MDPGAAFDAYHDQLFRYLVRLTGDPDLAADSAQEAFLRYAERPPATTDNLRAWLHRVGTNYALDTMRVSRRRAELLAAAPDRAPMGTAVRAPDLVLVSDERRAAVRRGLDELREKERVILLLRAEGFSYKEIAATANVPMNSVGAVAARGLKKLAKALHHLEGDCNDI